MNGTRKPRGCRCKVGLRRVSPVAVRSGDRLLSEPSADTQPCQREPLFMPHSGHSSPLLRGQGCPLSGWEQSFVSRQLFGCANCRGEQMSAATSVYRDWIYSITSPAVASSERVGRIHGCQRPLQRVSAPLARPWPLDVAAVLPSRPECTTQLAFRKVAAAFGHATFNNDAALVRN